MVGKRSQSTSKSGSRAVSDLNTKPKLGLTASGLNHNLVFGLDPSSTVTGYCVMSLDERLIEAGIIREHKMRASAESRIAVMCEDLKRLLNHWRPRTILIEWPSGHVGRKRHKGAGAGLSTYGVAVGALWRTCLHWRESLPLTEQQHVQVVTILENVWTGQVSKPDRVVAIASLFPEYNPAADRTGDIGDSVGLALWFIRERKVHVMEPV